MSQSPENPHTLKAQNPLGVHPTRDRSPLVGILLFQSVGCILRRPPGAVPSFLYTFMSRRDRVNLARQELPGRGFNQCGVPAGRLNGWKMMDYFSSDRDQSSRRDYEFTIPQSRQFLPG